MTFANNLRGWIFYFFLAISIIVLTVLLLCSWPFMSYERRYEAVCRPWAKCVLKLLDVICGVRWRAKGMENMPDIPCVVLVKHQWPGIRFGWVLFLSIRLALSIRSRFIGFLVWVGRLQA